MREIHTHTLDANYNCSNFGYYVSMPSDISIIDIRLEQNNNITIVYLFSNIVTNNTNENYYFYITTEYKQFTPIINKNYTDLIYLKSVDILENKYMNTYYIFYQKELSMKEIRNNKIDSVLLADNI